MTKALQYFSKEAIERGRKLSTLEVLEFLENFRHVVNAKPAKTKLISMKVPEDLLAAFKTKADLDGYKYQTLIKQLMRQYLEK